MTKRHFGLPNVTNEPYPEGCDWHKPPNCHCRLYAHAQACYERCDDYRLNWKRPPLRGFARWFANVVVTLVVLLMVLAIATKARGANLPVPPLLPRHAPTVELPPVVVEPPKPAKIPLYCKPLMKVERSCTGVRLTVEMLGRDRAKALAIRCGATPEELAQAEACLTK